MTSKESNSRFDRALSLLQSDFKILPVGISDAGGWRYAFIYDLTHRHLPELLEKARFIKTAEARRKLAHMYFLSVGAAQLKDVIKLFGWKKTDAERTVFSLAENGILQKDLKMESEDGVWFALPDIVS